ncbi:GtrA family protein [Arthrobacter sp. zg-Y859]|uniref:GtrA family protein n=1 Tax=Arthrobacter jinronghuae TaxID=2964609 RepID=A0ABT1NP51_9MICC|nr:GtrA family protein [Arthrobacter jinronghuae]MCQ1949506.1 GtrA family protein [Arthrobacter jinronghuae]UWX77723.1 GtrA family protein [Arthrobacter jinronghuae]
MSNDKDLGLRPPVSPHPEPYRGRITSPASRLRNLILGPAGRYLLVGGVSFAVDFFLLVLLHEYFGVELWLATPIAFLTSFAANYFLSRFFTFAGSGARGTSFVKYVALVLFNTVAASLIVSGFEAVGSSYMLGKVASTAMMTVWNYFLYKHFVFAQNKAPRVA